MTRRAGTPVRAGKGGAAIAAVTPLLLTLAGCTSSSQTGALEGPGYSDAFADIRETTESDFLREVLDDDLITEAELAEARKRFITCVNESGRLSAASLDDGGWEFSGPAMNTEEYRTITHACEEVAGAGTLTMYAQMMRDNPTNIDPYSLMALCLVKKGAVDPSYSGDQYGRDLERYFTLPESERQGDPERMIAFHDEEAGAAAYRECESLTAVQIQALPG
ncbi:hypothetical protein [Schaalia hyovaginalis]|uniref:hypothetical protein n=1 Tax=Schaalia hyovaginalis TaxID=29316 RepID=UPI0026EF67A3|nr:hypothetical protein [Schaalia hyovaginalis]MCI6410338.1 hypothetical protein [Schaalia hyovaginalis]